MTYALRACSHALLAGSNLGPASGSQVAVAGDRWLLMAVRGHLGDTWKNVIFSAQQVADHARRAIAQLSQPIPSPSRSSP